MAAEDTGRAGGQPTNDDIQAHCAEIDRCNQRGGRMLSIVNLMEAQTLTRDLAAYFLAAIGNGASFMVGALPGGAGKTTVMGALLNFVPPDVHLVPADSEQTIAHALHEHTRHCFICHEIGAGSYYAYLWGEPLRRYFDLPDAGHMLATNLHADTFDQARRQVCEQNGVTPVKFRRMNVIYFLAVEHQPQGINRRVTSVWESDGKSDHRQIHGGETPGLPADGTALVSAEAFNAAGQTIDRLMASGVRSIRDVRKFLVREHF